VQQPRTPKGKRIIRRGRRAYILKCDGLTPFSICAGDRCKKQKSLRRTITGAAQKNTGLSSTNADAQESPVVLQTHPTAGEKISDGRDRLSVAARTGADCQDQITQRQTREFSWLQNLSISFHSIASVAESNFGTIPICEYLIHKPHVVIHPLCTLSLTARRHFCSIFKHEILSACSSRKRD